MQGGEPRRPVLTAIELGADPAAWSGAGFTVDGSRVEVGGVAIELARPDGGISALAFDWLPAGIADIDGLPASVQSAAGSASHENGATAIDQVVISTPDFDRTAASLAAAGLGLRRERIVEGEGDEGAVRQGFVRAGGPVLELVHTDRVPGGPALGWGLGFICGDLERVAAEFEGVVGRLRDAVQPGRRIATVSRDARLGVPVVFLDPPPDTGV